MVLKSLVLNIDILNIGVATIWLCCIEFGLWVCQYVCLKDQ